MSATDHHDEWAAADGPAEPASLRVLLYSDHAQVRESVRLAVGRRIDKRLPPIEWLEVATGPAVISAVQSERFDLLVLDGETGKVGGLGLCRQLKDEVYRCPPIVVLTGRPQDAWLAAWSQADAVLARPFDPIVVQDAIASILRAEALAG